MEKCGELWEIFVYFYKLKKVKPQCKLGSFLWGQAPRLNHTFSSAEAESEGGLKYMLE